MKNFAFKIFILEDDGFYSELLEYHLSTNPDYELTKFHLAKYCLSSLYLRPHVVTLDYSLPDRNGAEVLKKVKEQSPDALVVVILEQEDVATAVDLQKKGDYDYILKDEDTPELLWTTISKIRENDFLRKEIDQLLEEIGQKYDFTNFITGSSESMKRVYALLDRAARTNITVFVTGETGTGKELAAKAANYNSSRKKAPYAAVNMAAIPPRVD